MTDKEYYDLVQPYHDAMKLLLTRLEVLNHTIYPSAASNPVHTVQSRIKKKASIEEKLMHRGLEPTVDNAKNVLQDIAGVRIVCYFTGDIHNLVNILKKQPDLIFIRERDYIENPKPNGYRSYHIIFWSKCLLSGCSGILSRGDTVPYYFNGLLGSYGAQGILQKGIC